MTMQKNFAAMYFQWLRDNTFLDTLDNGVTRISFPFLDQHNDYTEIFIVQQQDGTYKLTDDGQTIGDLEDSGLNLFGSRKYLMDQIVRSFGVNRSGNELFVTASLQNMVMRKHMFLSAISRVQDLFLFSRENVKNVFIEDMIRFLDSNDIRYSSDISRIGKSTLPFQFEFLISKSKTAPERAIRLTNTLDNDKSKVLIFGWEDTIQVRPKDSILYVFINDSGGNVKQSALSSLREYQIKPVFWDERQRYVQELAA